MYTYIHTYIHGSKVINFCIELYPSFEHMEKQRQAATFHQSQRQASKQASREEKELWGK
jgi:phage regulator Rha-like protein